MSIQPTPILLGPRLGMPPEESAVASLLHTMSKVLDVLRRRWPLLLIPMLTVMLVTLSVGLTYPRRYYVTTTFERRNNLVISKLIANNSPYSFAALRQSLVSDLRSFAAVGAALEETGVLDGLPRESSGEQGVQGRAMRDEIIGRWIDSITVIIRESGDFADIVEVRYLGDQPELAGAILTRLRDNYMASARAKVSEVIGDAHAFFEQEARKCEDKVAALRSEIRQIDLEYPGTNPNGTETVEHRLAAVSQSIEQLERERQKLQAAISARETYLAELSTRPAEDAPLPNQPAAVDRAAALNPQYQQVVGEIAALNKKIAELKSARRMTDMHPEILILRRRIESLQEHLSDLPERLEAPLAALSGATVAADPWIAERKKTEIEIKSYRENLAGIERDLKVSLEQRDRLRKDLEVLPERRERYARLQQALQSAQSDLDLWTNNMAQLNRILTAEAENRGIQVVPTDEPHLAGRLRTPTANGLAALSCGLGLALGALIVFLREILDRSIKDPARVKQTLGVPVLETIGEICVGRPRGWFLRRRLLPAFVAVEGLAVVTLGALVYLALERPEVYDHVITRSASLLGGWSG